MGTIIHKTVIVTGYADLWEETKNQTDICLAHEFAKALFADQVSDLISHPTNGDATFMVVSSGSKLGWQPQQEHDVNIGILIASPCMKRLETLVISHGETVPALWSTQ